MASSKITVTVEINTEKIEKLYDALKGLQTYKLAENDDRTLVVMDDVAEVLADYIATYTEQKKGKWEESDDGWDGVYYVCSECGCPWILIDGTPYDNGMNYCPNCGAKMEREQKHLGNKSDLVILDEVEYE